MPRTKGAAQLVDARPLLERISSLEQRVTALELELEQASSRTPAAPSSPRPRKATPAKKSTPAKKD